MDYYGHPKELVAEGMLATCIQHEIDHLEGILFIDYLSQLKKGSAVILRQLNNHKDWNNIFNKYFIEQKSFDLHWKIHDRSLFYDHFKLFIRK